MKQHPEADTRTIYQIQAQGQLDEDWSDWLSGVKVTFEPASDGVPRTTLTGPVADQAALRGLLCTLWDLNLTLISVRRIGERGEMEAVESPGADQRAQAKERSTGR
jgi:hypothetical protein